MTEAARPKLIAYVADVSARTQFILPNAEHINSLPFDGIVVNIPASWSSMSQGTVVTEADVRTWLAPLANFNAGKENYLAMEVDRPGDLFDDAAWAQVAANWKVVGKVAAETGFKGIFFDNEEYAGQWQNYPDNPTPAEAARGLAGYQAMASQRGREIMSALSQSMPDANVAIAHGPYLSVEAGANTPPAFQLQAGGPEFQELRGPFFTGFLEGMGPNQHLIDGGELYALRSAAEFKNSFDYRNGTLPQLINWNVDSQALNQWASKVDVSHMVYTDEYPVGYKQTPDSLVTTLLNAFDNSENAVFLYSESAQVPWLTPDVKNQAWVAATSRAVELADHTMKGTTAADTLSGSTFMDRIMGGAGNDRLSGGLNADMLMGETGDDLLEGGAGADTIIGGIGFDTVSFSRASSGVTVNLLTKSGTAGEALGDTYEDVENIIGSNFSDTLTTSNTAGRLDGYKGDDSLTGGNGNDVFFGGSGADKITGGAGIDRAFYSSSTAVNINLATNVNSGGEAQGDTFFSIEEVSGSAQADTITGNDLNNRFFGQNGNDRLGGGKGVDVLVGGAGSDTFVFAAGDTGQTAVTADVVQDFAKGAFGSGDTIDFTAVLSIGGASAAATTTQAAINQTTGVASFAAGSGTTMADAIADIVTSFTAAGNAAGEFALFRVNGTGNLYMLISDGVAGLGANDVLVQLGTVTSVTSISIANGDLTVLA